MGRFLLTVLLSALAFSVFGIDVGGTIEKKEILPGLTSVAGPDRKGNEDYDVFIFLDPTSQDSRLYLQKLDYFTKQIQDFPLKKTVSVFVITRGSKQAAASALSSARISLPLFYVYSDEARKVFAEYAASEIVLPFALIVKGSSVRWKGNPTEIESVLNHLIDGTFSYSSQLKVDQLKQELKTAIQTSLPDVVIKTADKILELQPGDNIAISAKLMVLNSQGRTREIIPFLRGVCEKASGNQNVRMLYLDMIVRYGDKELFRKELQSQAESFKTDTGAKLRLLAFVLENVPFTWLPAKTMSSLAASTLADCEKAPASRKAMALELSARVKYVLCDLDGAVKEQEAALLAARGTRRYASVLEVLNYYREIQSVRVK